MPLTLKKALLSTVCSLAVCGSALAETPSKSAVLDTYADIALAKYTDSLVTAQALDSAVDNLLANPSEATLSAAKAA